MSDEDFEFALRAELEPAELVVWRTQPNVDAVRGSLLSFSVLWLSGLFMLGAGVMRTATDDSRVLTGLIVLLIIVAFAGTLELIFVPRRAGRTIYVLTDRRVFSLCVTRRYFKQQDPDYHEKQVLRVSKNSIGFFYLSNLPSQIMFCILAYDVAIALVRCIHRNRLCNDPSRLVATLVARHAFAAAEIQRRASHFLFYRRFVRFSRVFSPGGNY